MADMDPPLPVSNQVPYDLESLLNLRNCEAGIAQDEACRSGLHC